LATQLMASGQTTTDLQTLQGQMGSETAVANISYPAFLADRHLISAIVTAAIDAAQFAADRNGDLKVDCADVKIVRDSFGLDTRDAGFDPRADVNGDGIVDRRDLRFVLRQLPRGTDCGQISARR
jgi:hypothetical protein